MTAGPPLVDRFAAVLFFFYLLVLFRTVNLGFMVSMPITIFRARSDAVYDLGLRKDDVHEWEVEDGRVWPTK